MIVLELMIMFCIKIDEFCIQNGDWDANIKKVAEHSVGSVVRVQ